MSTMSTVSPSSENTTAEQFSLFARDVNDKLLVLYNNIYFGITVLSLILGFVVVVSSLKKLSELAHSFTDSKTKNPADSWVVRKLKSKYAALLVICGNGSILLLIGALQFLIYFDVGGEAVCDSIMRVETFCYALSLWTTYVIFEIRRISTGTENFKGIKYWIMHAVRFGTLCMPAFAILGYFATSGIYLVDVQQCIFTIDDPTIVLLAGVGDAMLSMGHIMLFIFAVRQKSNFKVAVVGSGNKVKPSTASTPYVKSNLALMNRDLASPQDDPASKIKAIARRNFRLALVTVVSTAVALGTTYLVNSNSPPPDSSSARSYFYLGHVGTMVVASDLIVNSLSILIMTSAWQPTCLKKLTTKVTAAAAYKQEESSDVSTLGGGS